MKKLIDVKLKYFNDTLRDQLPSIIKSCSRYINEIRNYEMLENFWKELKTCQATMDDAIKLQNKLFKVIDECDIDYNSMFGFSFQPVVSAIGLIISTLKDEQ